MSKETSRNHSRSTGPENPAVPKAPDPAPEGREDSEGGSRRKLACSQVQDMLFAYIARELSPADTDCVKEHLVRCPKCRVAISDIEATLKVLHEVPGVKSGLPDRLSDAKRNHIFWALAHPVGHWIEKHHVLMSVIAGALVTIIVILACTRVRIERMDSPTKTIPVKICPPMAPEPEEGAPVDQK